MRTATKQEAINGNSNDTVITPLRLKQVLDTVDINPGEGGGGSGSDTPVYTAGAGISITNNVITNTITKTSQLTNDSNFITAEDIPDFPEIEQKDEVIISSSKPTNGEDIWIQDSANLFIPKQTYFGSYIKSDGSLGAKGDSRYWINDYQEIEPSTVYTFSRKIFGAGYHAWYDANKNLISTFNQENNAVTTATSPSNAKYIRLSMFSGNANYGDDLDTFQFVKGTKLPPYDKYVDGTKVYAKKADGSYEEIYNSKETSGSYTLPPATSSTLGGIKVGDNLTITDDGTLSAIASPGGEDNTDIDPVPINSIWDYEGDTVPDGFIEYTGEIGGGGTSLVETDPTVPAHVKAITLEDIAKWNSGTGSGGSGGSGGSLEIETIKVPLLETINEDGWAIQEILTLRKCGNICALEFNGGDGLYLENNVAKVIAVAPEGYRPVSGSVLSHGFYYDWKWDRYYDVRLSISTAGEIKLIQNNGSKIKLAAVYGQLVYLVDEPLQLPSGGSSYEPNIMTVIRRAKQTLTQQTYNKIIFDNILGSVGNKLEFVDGGIKIGAGVKKIKLSGYSTITTTAGYGAIHLRLVKNELINANNLCWLIGANSKPWDQITMSFPSSIAEVNEGDIIYMYIYTEGTGQSGADNNVPQTNLTVEVIQ